MNPCTLLRRTRAGLLAAAFLGVAGTAAAVDAAARSASSSSAGAQARVEALIGDAGCDDQRQCRTVGIGARACGGPERWLAWSTKSTDPGALHQAVQAQARASRDEDRRRGLASDCRVLPPPPAVCRPRVGDGKKTCQLGQGGLDSAV